MNYTSPTDVPASFVHSKDMRKYVPSLNNLPLSVVEKKLDVFFKFMFVRDPLERILSAYKNKFRNKKNTYFPGRFGKYIIKKYRKNANNRSLATGDDVTFDEFVQYLLDPRKKHPLNEHWKPMHELCSPCYYKYDLIGKYQTVEEDAQYILKVYSI